MKANRLAAAAVVLIGGLSFARADLMDRFLGFDSVWETGLSGLVSSYYDDTKLGLPVSGPTTGNVLPTLGPGRVTYPSGIGQVPSPGGATGRNFDQGVLGIKIEDDNLVVQVAAGLNPQTGFYHSGWQAWYGQGDMFLDVLDSKGVSHFALLTTWPRDASGNPIGLNRGYFSKAMGYHVSGGTGGGSLEGHLVALGKDSDVTLSGGTGAYNASNAPTGLDLRVYAQGGTDLGYAGLLHSALNDLGQDWYLQTWTVKLSSLSADPVFQLALHSAPSCGNDQIGGVYASIPEPDALLVALAGLLVTGRKR